MPKWKHHDPHAEALIESGELRGWQSRAELAELEAREREQARRVAELRAVPWDDLSPAELLFRWMLAHPPLYAAWAHETREAWKARRATGHGH